MNAIKTIHWVRRIGLAVGLVLLACGWGVSNFASTQVAGVTIDTDPTAVVSYHELRAYDEVKNRYVMGVMLLALGAAVTGLSTMAIASGMVAYHADLRRETGEQHAHTTPAPARLKAAG